jgi:hypothetical protein
MSTHKKTDCLQKTKHGKLKWIDSLIKKFHHPGAIWLNCVVYRKNLIIFMRMKDEQLHQNSQLKLA